MSASLAKSKNITLSLQKKLGLIFVTVLLFALFSSILPAQAINTIDGKTLDWQVKSWWYARTLESCYKTDNTKSSDKETDPQKVANGQLFWSDFGNKSGTMFGAYMGTYVGGAGSAVAEIGDDGWGHCGELEGEVSKAALAHWGISALDLVCSPEMQAQGVYKRENGQDCKTGNNRFQNFYGDRAKAAQGLLDYLKNNIYNGASIPSADASNLSPAQKYVFWSKSLVNACSTGASGTTMPGGSPDMRYQIVSGINNNVPQGIGGVPPVTYTYYTATGDRNHGWGGHALPNGNKTKCIDMQNNANGNNNANYVAYANYVATVDPGSAINPGTGGAGTGGGEADPCDAIYAQGDGGGMALRWLTCPVMKSLSWVTNVLDGALSGLLRFDMTHFENDGFYAVWKNFRNIALALLVIAALVMVISQAAGAQILDAYTIKKVLPRLLIAIIAIALSWPLLRFGVQLFNDLGGMVNNLILQPFTSVATNASDQLAALNGTSLGGVVGVATGLNEAVQTAQGVGILAGGTIVAGASALAIYGPIGVLSIVGVAVLALIVAVLALGLRAIIIIAGIVFAPIAIACFILPSTEKIWKFWWSLMLGALAMFPIVMGFLALGKAGAMITPNPLLAMLLFIAPYFLIPFAFKLGSGFVGKIMTAINDSERGLFDRAKKFRGAQAQKNVGEMLEGKRFKGTGAFSRGLNKATGSVGALRHVQTLGNMKGQMYAGEQAQSDAVAQKELKENMYVGAVRGDDDMVYAMRDGHDAASVAAIINDRKRAKGQDILEGQALNSAVQNVLAARSSMSEQVRGKVAHMALAASGTGYADVTDMAEGARLAAGGDRAATERLAFTGRSLMSQARPDSNLAAGDLTNLVSDVQNGTLTDTKKQDYILKALMNSDDTLIARSKGQTHTAARNTFQSRINEILAKGDTATGLEKQEMGKIVAKMENIRDSAGQFGNTDEKVKWEQSINGLDDVRRTINSGNMSDFTVIGYREARSMRGIDPTNPSYQPPAQDEE